jgi:hypothetical protein
VPLDHGFGLDEDQRISPVSPETAEENPECAVTVLQVGTLVTSAKDLELVAEGDVLENERLTGAKRASEQV